MNEPGPVSVRTAPTTATWRLRSWPGDPTVGHLVLVDHQRLPEPATVAAGLDTARRRGYRGVRTSALFPAAAQVLASMGFVTADRLALLRRDGLAGLDALDGAAVRLRRLRPWQFGAAADVDRVAFGREWGNDAAALRDITGATPLHRARAAGRPLDGFAISGASGTTGYLQRIAVHPGVQRTGIATALVTDALAWMAARGLTAALVNTGTDNLAALALYERFGFVRLGDDLTVAEFRFDD